MSHSKRQLASHGVCVMPKLFVCRMLNRAASFLDPVPTIFCHATMARTSYVGQADKDVAGVGGQQHPLHAHMQEQQLAIIINQIYRSLVSLRALRT